MPKDDGVSQHIFREFFGFAFDHHNGVPRSGQHDIQIAFFQPVIIRRINDEIPIHAPHAHCADWA